MKKRYLSAALFIALFFVIGANTYKTAEPAATQDFVNLKVLPKDITHEKLDSVMGNWSVSLGVKCNFCHAMNKDTLIKRLDFASDDNDHKEVARYMFNMTNEINAKYFNNPPSTRPDTLHSVVCYTCHRGTKEPKADIFLTQIDSTLKSHRKK